MKAGISTRLQFLLIGGLLVVVLIISRGVLGGIYQFASEINWAVGVAFLILVSILVTWVGLRFASSYGEDQNSVVK